MVTLNQLTIVVWILAAQIVNWLIAEKVPDGATAEMIRQSWNGQYGWRWMFTIVAIPAIIFFVTALFIPESPRWLAKTGNKEQARRTLARTLRKMLSDDFMGTSLTGGVLSKTDVVPADGVPANHMPKSTLRDSAVRIFGDTAVLMGNAEMQIPQKSEVIRMTTVFQKHGEDWQVIAVHMSRVQD